MRNRAATAKSLMVMGTASDVGKSVVVTGLCRLFANAGIAVAPFKSQNMSNNAAVCGGGEIGRAQAVQAEACRLEPGIDMNPVLLKPESDHLCQVVIGGRAQFRMGAREYAHYREHAWPAIVSSYSRLSSQFELVLIEGAGGAAEVNLRERDIVNWEIAKLADAPVLIVADIDKGGAIASLVGTVALLSDVERARVKGFIINKFRGDLGLVQGALHVIEDRTNIPVLGVLPYAEQLEIPEEDGASLRNRAWPADRPIRIGVIAPPRISNYTDFEPFLGDPDVALEYLKFPDPAREFDVLCLPGTKATVADLAWLREVGWARRLAEHRDAGGAVVGVCGGYQMLGRRISDPDQVESNAGEVAGLAMLDIETVFEREKVTARVRATHLVSGLGIEGYEIHCGRIANLGGGHLLRVVEREAVAADEPEGAASTDGRVLGSTIHGLFDASRFRRHFLNEIRARKRLPPLDPQPLDARAVRDRAYDRLARMMTEHLDMRAITALACVDSPEPPPR